MNIKGQNRSVRRTKSKIRQGVTNLLKEKPLSSITVREIADLVDINRGTFYLYYKDVYDLIEQIETELFEEFNEIVKLQESDIKKGKPSPILNDVFTFLADNADICMALLGPNGDPVFVDKFKEVMRERCLYYWTEIYNAEQGPIFDYFYAFFISGSIGMFQEWLKRDMKEPPKIMAAIMDRMITYGAKALGEK